MIHPLALIDPKAELGRNVEVGPWTLIGPDVKIGDNTRIASHVVIKGPTEIGQNNRIFQFSSIGEECQDLKYKGEPTRLVIGDNNTIRESVTIHRGTVQDQGLTRIGDHNLLMAYVHVAHDCVVGSHSIFANNTALAGHVIVDDYVIFGGYSKIHQFCRIGAYSMTAINSVVVKDVPAFVMVQGDTASAHGMNFEGMRRKGFSAEEIADLRLAYKIVYRQKKSLAESIEQLRTQFPQHAKVQLFIDSLEKSSRGITR
ncbi:MAG TPA: acyl-ACP--UDP-N-acetylglucosamine O-acyltransferase [Pseudomonadales bacterium]|nr:acyl-ACP--UDP-N-acetylglucosamine O-acyltransferase [Pseudomonadales bacterium]